MKNRYLYFVIAFMLIMVSCKDFLRDLDYCEDTPQNISVIRTTFDSIYLHWDFIPNAKYIINYKKSSDLWENALLDTVQENQFSLKIDGCEIYDFRVLSQCTNSITSSFSNIVTLPLPMSPTHLSVNEVTNSSARLFWKNIPNATFTLRYKPITTTTWVTISTPINQNFFTLSGLNNMVTYECQVQRRCANGDSSEYSSSLLFTTGITGGIPMVFVKGGTYQMGQSNPDINGVGTSYDEQPVHEVTLNDYYIGMYEITQAQWKEVMGNNPAHFANCDNCPIENISWDDILIFLNQLNSMIGSTNYRLLTEAEWEYAARGGQYSKGYKYPGLNNDDISSIAWYIRTADNNNMTHPIGTRLYNELTLYDMSGNVAEFCSDWYGTYPNSAQTNPSGPISNPNGFKVSRGGAYDSDYYDCRSSSRDNNRKDTPEPHIGFRIAISL